MRSGESMIFLLLLLRDRHKQVAARAGYCLTLLTPCLDKLIKIMSEFDYLKMTFNANFFTDFTPRLHMEIIIII